MVRAKWLSRLMYDRGVVEKVACPPVILAGGSPPPLSGFCTIVTLVSL